MSNPTDNYETFGEEWRGFMRKMTKEKLIDFARNRCKANLEMADQLRDATKKIPRWTDAFDYLPDNCRCVLATDGESHFIACYENGEWSNAHTDDVIDSVIMHWMELPEIPE